MKDKDIKIRISVPDDIFAIRRVVRTTWINTYPNEELGITVDDIMDKFKDDDVLSSRKKIEKRKERYKDKNCRTWVAECDGEVVAFCSSSYEEENGRVNAIYVLPEYQRDGIGGKLMSEALNWLSGAKVVFINVVEYNLKAVAFYKKHGFSETGKRGCFDDAASLPSGKEMIEIELVRKM